MTTSKPNALLHLIDKKLLDYISGSCNCFCSYTTNDAIPWFASGNPHGAYVGACDESASGCNIYPTTHELWLGYYRNITFCTQSCRNVISNITSNYIAANLQNCCNQQLTATFIGSFCI